MKKKIMVILPIVAILVVLLGVGILFVVNNSRKTEESSLDANSHETFKKIYTTDDNVLYYSNDQEKIYKFSGYKYLDNYFYNNVACGHDESYKYFLIDINEKYIVEPGTYNYISRASGKYYYITQDSKRGIIDYEGNVIVPAEYSIVSYNKDDGMIYFIAEKHSSGDEYYLLNEDGKEIFKADTAINKIDITTYKGFNKKTIPTIEYEGTLYSMKDGKVLLTDLESGDFGQNYFLKDGNLTIYDESFKVKKVIKDFESTGITKGEDKIYFDNSNGEEFYLNNKLEFVKINEEDDEKEFLKKEGFTEIEGADYHIFADGSKCITKVDENANLIIIYDKSGKEIRRVEFKKARDIYALGNYLAVEHGINNKIYLIEPSTGDRLVDFATYATYYEENGIIVAGYSGRDYTLINENFTLDFRKNYSFHMSNDGFWALDQENNKAYYYNLKGEIKNELTGIESEFDLADGYFMYIFEDGKTKIINAEDGNITIELSMEEEFTNYYIPYEFNEENIGIIEADDGLYKLNGEKIIEKE